MTGKVLTLYGLECAGTHMECELAALDAEFVTLSQRFVGEMQPGRGSSHAAVDVAIHSLVVGGVARLGFAVEVWRNGNFAYAVEDRGKRHVVAVPTVDDFP